MGQSGEKDREDRQQRTTGEPDVPPEPELADVQRLGEGREEKD